MAYNARYHDSELVDTSDEDENEDMSLSKQDKGSAAADHKKGMSEKTQPLNLLSIFFSNSWYIIIFMLVFSC
ncbi:hypothetical protein EON63_21665 [archaeon]|nr:MAG: hypothetical protein EON63_21665 [archaeon]